MANKSLTDLTARTATADSDLLHINSGGTDYKEQKIDFLMGDLFREFSNTTSLTAQVDALPNGTYYGSCSAYGHQSETGAPVNGLGYVDVQKLSSNNTIMYYQVVSSGIRYYKKKVSGTWDSSWTQEPTRDEITSLNNSLTNIGKQVISRYEPISVTASLAYTGMYFTLTKTSIVRVSHYYTYSTPQVIAICSGSSGNQGIYAHAEALSGVTNVYITCTAVLGAGTYYVWAKASSSATNNIALLAIQIEP